MKEQKDGSTKEEYQKPQIVLDDIIDKKKNYSQAVKIALFHRRVSIVGYNPLLVNSKHNIQLDRINKIDSIVPVCHCCGRFARGYLKVNFSKQQLGFLGQGYALFFNFQTMCLLMLIILYLLVLSNDLVYHQLTKSIKRKKLSNFMDKTDLLCICVTVLCQLIILKFSYNMRQLAIRVDEKDTSPEDYSVLVKNIPIEFVKSAKANNDETLSIEQQLKKFFQTCFKKNIIVDTVCLCYNLVPLEVIQNHKQKIIELYKKSRQSLIYAQIQKKLYEGQQTTPIILEYYGVQPDTQASITLQKYNKISFCQQKINMLNKRIDQGYRDNKLLFIGQAIISFDRQDMADYILNGENNQTKPRAYFYGSELALVKPQHPKGIYWHNLHFTEKDYKIRNRFSLISCGAIFLCSIFIQVLSNYLQLRYSSKIFAYLSLLIINIINILIPTFVLTYFSTFEGKRTRTDEVMSFVKKSFLLQLMNTLVVPLIVVFLFNKTEESYFESQNGVMFRNAMFSVIQLMISFKLIYKQFKIWAFSQGYTFKGLLPKYLTFREFLELYEFPPFQIEARASDILKTMVLSFFLGYQLKRVVLYSILSFYFNYWMDKYNLTRRRVVKSHINETLNFYMMRIAHFSVTAFLLCQIYFYKSLIKGVLLVISLILFYKPFINYVGSDYKKNQVGKNYQFSVWKDKIFQTDYIRENPATKGVQQRKFVNYIKSKKQSQFNYSAQ